jgi:hypothetical protein
VLLGLFIPSEQKQDQRRGDEVIQRKNFCDERPRPECRIDGEQQRRNQRSQMRSGQSIRCEVDNADRRAVADH